jgi:adenylylsulfate kinase
LLNGVTVWFTGLSGAGKTTLSQLVESELKAQGRKVEVLDGDEVRRNLTAGLGFSREDRIRNNELVTYIAKLLTRNDVFVLVSLISPYREMRSYAREEIGCFIEVYVRCSLEECIRRDVKGLYKKALNGEITSFTGISDPFEEPEHSEIIVDTDLETINECVDKILNYLTNIGYLVNTDMNRS